MLIALRGFESRSLRQCYNRIMKLVRHEHSCLVVEEGGSRLVIDPGVWSPAFKDYANTDALIITHVHADHFMPEVVKAILAASPKLAIFSTSQVAKELPDIEITVPEIGKKYQAGALQLQFFGGKHAIIRPGMPQDENFGVLVNDTLYDPGDSFAPTGVDYEWLAVPVTAPWSKVSETASFVEQSPASKVFPIHTAILSEAGLGLYDRLIGLACEQAGKEYHVLKPGESLDI